VLATIFPLYLLVKELTKSSLHGILAIILYVFSPFLVRMSFDLIKNAMGLLFLTSFMLFYVLMLKADRKVYMLLSILMLVLTSLTHILDYGIALLFLILSTIMYQ